MAILSDLWSRLEELEEYLQIHIYQRSKEIAFHIVQQYGVEITPNGVRGLLHRIGFVFKKMKHLPGKGDAEVQQEFVKNMKNSRPAKEKRIKFIL